MPEKLKMERDLTDWRDLYSLRCQASPAELQQLADSCEAAPAREQRRVFERVLPLLTHGCMVEAGLAPVHDQAPVEQGLPAMLLADAGAYESAVLALLPPRATFTGGRMADGGFVAQVILRSGAGAHSRQAKTLAMGWLAALLRALAREIVEQRGRM